MGLIDSLLSSGLLSGLMTPNGHGLLGERPNQSGSWLRPDSPLYNMFNGPFNAPLPTPVGAPSLYDEAGFAGMFSNAPPAQQPMPPPPQPENVPLPLPRPPGLGQQFMPRPMPQPQEAALPPNAQPTQGQLSPIAPLEMGDRFIAGANNFSSGGNPIAMLTNVAKGFSTGQRFDAPGIQQQNQIATARAIYSGLQSDGRYSPQQAQAIAMAASTNPELAKAILPQVLGPKEAPKTVNWKDENGIERTAFYDPKSAQYVDMQSGRPVRGLGIAAPPPTASPYSAGAPPPGVDATKWRQDEAARLSDAEKDLRTKGEGALEFLPDAIRVMGKIKAGKYDEAIGPIVGSPAYNEYVRGIGGAVDPTGTARRNLGSYNELNADIKRLGTSNLKAQFGGRITNVEIGQNNQTFGGAQSADPATAHSILGERVKASFETLQRNIDSGFIKPSAVPPEVVQAGVAMGALKPQSFGVQAPSEGGWIPIGNGVRIREKK